jgi:hypothetical protein
MHTKFKSENLKGRNHLGDLDIHTTDRGINETGFGDVGWTEIDRDSRA